jgi:hypothetical protein
MIDRSESHLIAREQRNRGDASNGESSAGAVRARRAALRASHESVRAQRIEPTVGDLAKPTVTKDPR